MKRWIGIGLVLTLLLSGCAQKPAQSTKRDPVEFSGGEVVRSDGAVTRVETQPETQPTEPIPEDVSSDDLVEDYCDRELEYVDTNGNRMNCEYEVPALNLSSPDAAAVNQELQELADSVLAEATEAVKNRTGLADQGISYESWVKDRVLVLLVTVDNVWDCDRYLAYTFDLDTGARLDHEGIAQRMGDSPEELEAKLAQAVEREYRQTYEGMEEMDARFYAMQLDRSLDPENLAKAEIYPDESGTFMVVANIYSLAGADAYTHNFPL